MATRRSQADLYNRAQLLMTLTFFSKSLCTILFVFIDRTLARRAFQICCTILSFRG